MGFGENVGCNIGENTGHAGYYRSHFTLDADSVAYTVTGANAGLSVDYGIEVDSGSYLLTGADIELTTYGANVDSGSYTITGADVAFTITRGISAGTGSYLVNGANATLQVPVVASTGIWLSAAEIAALPASGTAWDEMYAIAISDFGVAIGGHNDNHDTYTLAQSYVAARLNDNTLKTATADNLMSAIGSDELNDGNSLSISRNLCSYVMAADVIDFKNYDPTREIQFRAWAEDMLTKEHDGGGCGPSGCSIIGKNEDRPNNHGTMAGASRAATSVYVNDSTDVARTAQVFEGYLGSISTYADFYYGDDLSWQCDPDNPVGVNPLGCTKDGHSIDGALPEEMRRGGPFTWPPTPTGYAWEALQGAVTQAEILYRAGYDVWNWEDQALLRAIEFLYDIGWDAEGDDLYILHIINYRYGTTYTVPDDVGNGKNNGWTGWTHGER